MNRIDVRSPSSPSVPAWRRRKGIPPPGRRRSLPLETAADKPGKNGATGHSRA
ncbi:hypothetical protein [Micromonospora craniellae]|uniref:hypothetical protein n=1 Tax=Micromonospora craniellae TaxID=2294034 RepID=UPI001313F3B6|nr:hypothetical protein [Micromonospora craniellae]QOC92146.1 hypothetical protein ID554_30600 [Micromonospora craniellae]